VSIFHTHSLNSCASHGPMAVHCMLLVYKILHRILLNSLRMYGASFKRLKGQRKWLQAHSTEWMTVQALNLNQIKFCNNGVTVKKDVQDCSQICTTTFVIFYSIFFHQKCHASLSFLNCLVCIELNTDHSFSYTFTTVGVFIIIIII